MTIFHRSLRPNLSMMIFFVVSAAIPAFAAVLLLTVYQSSGGNLVASNSTYEDLFIGIGMIVPIALLSSFMARRYYKLVLIGKHIRIDYFVMLVAWLFCIFMFIKIIILVRDLVFNFDSVNSLTLAIVFAVAMLFGFVELVVVRRSPRREDIR